VLEVLVRQRCFLRQQPILSHDLIKQEGLGTVRSNYE
jgi:hypothetical protein